MLNADHSYHSAYVFETHLHCTVVVHLLLLQYKKKRSSSDPPSVKIEGEQTNDWFAIDLGVCDVFISFWYQMYIFLLEAIRGTVKHLINTPGVYENTVSLTRRLIETWLLLE